MPNQIAIPSTGAGAALSPQPVSYPYASGTPKEGPKSAIVFMTIPAGALSQSLQINLSQFGMSMVQSLLVNNEPNNVSITVSASGGGLPGLNFGIQPQGAQIIPVFSTGTLLLVQVTLASAQPSPVGIFFQIFNTVVPPAQWVSNLSVAGNVNIASVSGTISVTGSTVSVSGTSMVALQAGVTGGAAVKFFSALSTTVKSIKATPGIFKGLFLDNTQAAAGAAAYLQLFDLALPGSVTLGVTVPTLVYSAGAVGGGAGDGAVMSPVLPPEGITFTNGLQIAATTTATGAGVLAAPPNVTAYYF